MLVLYGEQALSPFRLDRLKEAIAEVVPGLEAIAARSVYLVDLLETLAPEELERLEKVLCDGPSSQDAFEGTLRLVVPRLGTLSPWSSKATEIVQRCGLLKVKRVERGTAFYLKVSPSTAVPWTGIDPLLCDPMTEQVLASFDEAEGLFLEAEPRPLGTVDVLGGGKEALRQASFTMGLALSEEEMDFLLEHFLASGRNPTDVELMMFAQANSEHCRHKVFNARWVIDGKPRETTLFEMIKATYRRHPEGIYSAYRDNGAVMAGHESERFFPFPDGLYGAVIEEAPVVMKVETHNHPTAISPFPGAATGSGGEIRDEGATGRGGKPKAGLTGFAVSNLRIPGFLQPWEKEGGKPKRIASALDIMLEGPIGSASFNNEFGRPNIFGFFRTLELLTPGKEVRGYHKPIMLAGGLGHVRPMHIHKRPLPPGAQVIVIGGPAMLIGLGGGAASSMASGTSEEALDFASVQRSNPEMQRRAQEVIDRCWGLGEDNPILSIHDVGAGGLANAVPELLHGGGVGGRIELRAIPSADPGMSPMEIWCNEAQERYVLAILPEDLERFRAICARERCPCAVIGETTEERRLLVGDGYFDNIPVDIPLDLLFGKPPKVVKEANRVPRAKERLGRDIDLKEAAYRVLRLPSVAAKDFLITIGDRTVGGLVARDPMVGPWQVPVSDVAVTATDFSGYSGEAMALGERPPIALLHPQASGRMAVGEAITNLAAADVPSMGKIKLSANWMAAVGHPGEDAALFDTVEAVGELCQQLKLVIPVGKDSLSMKTVWDGKAVTSPLSLVITAFAPVEDVRRTLTPELKRPGEETDLVLVDLGRGKNRLGGSALAQVYGSIGPTPPDVDNPRALVAFFEILQTLRREGLLLAYHDRSDGGLWATLCEMAFASRMGLDVELDALGPDPLAALFSEELGAVLQVNHQDLETVLDLFHEEGLGRCVHPIGVPNDEDRIRLIFKGKVLLEESRTDLHRAWAETSYRIQSLRDHPDGARQAFDNLLDKEDQGLFARLTFDPEESPAFYIKKGVRPPVAILREQGINGHVEMAAAFHRAGFDCWDVTMEDLLQGGLDLSRFKGLVACGGFSYGDVLGAGGGWAKSILFHEGLVSAFARFFERDDTFTLGVCNGCQMLARLKDIIPGSEGWPDFKRNLSEQFEARLVMVEVLDSSSLFFTGMAGSMLPIVVAHGEGRAVFEGGIDEGKVCLRYVDHRGRPTERYPFNPNGSPLGITGVTSRDGRVTLMMPHPERLFRTVQFSWHPEDWGERGPWLRLFENARRWVG